MSEIKPIAHHVLYHTWVAMKQRCYNDKHEAYHNYGGRGIIVCNAWRENFLQFVSDMGERPEHMSLDRIDVDGNYEPTNCRWADRKTQANNTRKKKHGTYVHYTPNVVRKTIEYEGVLHSLKDLAKVAGVSHETIRKRLKNGMTPEAAVLTPLIRVSKRNRESKD